MEHMLVWVKGLLTFLAPGCTIESWMDHGDGESCWVEIRTPEGELRRINFNNSGTRLLVEEETMDGMHAGVLLRTEITAYDLK